ncbi:Ureide permease 5 [Triticum urartu]|uniref:Protein DETOXIFICATION n=1 Tax=Triticum urartu TaxID=4572 RepID=M7Z3M4_TRIUA|nr:Ureide permease 5 [Triticum urartu]
MAWGRLPQHTYLDYSITNLLAAVLIALTLGQLGETKQDMPNFFTQLSQVFGSSTLKGLGLVFFAGVCLSLFSPALNLATNDQWHTLKGGVPHLVVYTAFFYFSMSCFVIGVGLNILFLYRPMAGVPKSSFKAYLSDWEGRQWALLAGLLCGFGNGFQFMGGQAAGYAAADAVEVFDEMLSLLSRTRLHDPARRVMRLMIRRRMRRGTQQFAHLMLSYSRAGKLRSAMRVLQLMQKGGCAPDILICNVAVNALVFAGRIDKALEFSDRMRRVGVEPDVVTYNCLIKGLCSVRRVVEALEMIDVMLQNGCPPDKITYYTVMGFLCKEKRVAEETMEGDGDTVTAPLLEFIDDRSAASEELLRREPVPFNVLSRLALWEAGNLWRISWASILITLFSFTLSLVTQMFVGHLGELELAGASITNIGIQGLAYGIMLGMSTAVQTVCGQAYGARRYRAMGVVCQRALLLQFVTAVAIAFFYWFLQAQNIVNPVAYMVLAVLVFHILISWLAVFVLSFGLLGAALTLSFSCINYWNWDFQIMLGLSYAASIRVGNELGAGHPKVARLSVLVVVTASIAFSILATIVVMALRYPLSTLYTSSTTVIEAVIALMPLLAISIFLNGIQPILSVQTVALIVITARTNWESEVDAVDQAHDAATVAAEVRNTTTALGPELAIVLCNTTAAIGVATCGHHDRFHGLNIPVTANISPPPHV